MRKAQNKIRDLVAAREWRENLRQDDKSLVVTNGCFDLIHRGHMEYLQTARSQGDALLVALNSDSSIREIKGDDRPIIVEQDRAFLLASLEAVDCVVLFSEARATTLLQSIPPDIYVKGGDYTEETLDKEEYSVLKESGCRFKFINFVQGYSTTNLIEKIKKIG